MESLQVPVDDLARLCHLASLGKLLGGLIHNLNSPLHSMGMQMDVIQHFILQKDDPGTVLSEKISARLAQMNEEFENLSNQIRIAGMRADLQESYPEKFNLNNFLHQELQFLKTNLHFKHNVETTTEFSPSLRVITPSSPYFSLALSLLLERVAEELENAGSRRLFLATSENYEGHPIISIRMDGTIPPKPFRDILEMNPLLPGDLPHISEEINLLISVLLLRSGGAHIETNGNDQGTFISIRFPQKTSSE